MIPAPKPLTKLSLFKKRSTMPPSRVRLRAAGRAGLRRLPNGFRLPPLVLVVIAFGSNPAAAGTANHAKPTAKDRADAAAFVAAAEAAHKGGMAAVTTLPNLYRSTKATCGGAVGKAMGDPSIDPPTLETLLTDAYEMRLLEVLGPTVSLYSRRLQAVHARDRVLLSYASYVKQTILPRVEEYAAAPRFDLCKLFKDWETTGYKAGFDWVRDAGVPRGLAGSVEKNFGSLGTPPALYNPIGNRLVAFGVRSNVAFWFPNALLHAAGQ